MKFVVKLGGAALEKPELLAISAQAIADLARDGHQVALVHGGGVQLTRLLAQMGKKSEFVSGLRITDAETRDAALMVLGGRVNKLLVAALTQLGVSAGETDGGLTVAAKGGDERLINAAGEDHQRGVAGLGVGDAEAGDELALLAHQGEGAGKLHAATVDDGDLVAVAGQFGDGLGAGVEQRRVFERSTAKFDYEFHRSPSASFQPYITFMFCTA